MLRLLAARVRHRPGTLLAPGVAVVLGTLFVAVALALGASLQATVRDGVARQHTGTDVVVTGRLAPPQLAELRALPGADVVEPRRSVSVELAGRTADAEPAPADRRLQWQQVVAGRFPEAPGEVALTASTARRLDLAVGDVARLSGDDQHTAPAERVRIVGEVELTGAPQQAGSMLVLAHTRDVERWAAEAPYDGAVLLARPGVTDQRLASQVRRALGPGPAVRTGAEQVDLEVAEVTGGVDVLRLLLLALAAVALFVAALVVANTFAVLVAQRTRELALLRCLGAGRGQVRRQVLGESALLGAVASLAGAALGGGLLLLLATAVDRSGTSLQPVAVLPRSAVWVPVVAGTVMTVAAASLPAHRATRIAPLAALRPDRPTRVRSRSGAVRLLVAAAFGLSGAALLVTGAARASIPAGLAGGVMSFTGVLLASMLVLPPVVAWLGRALARWGGVPARMAADGALRNPERTTVTAAALLVGTTLVALVLVGGASTRASVQHELSSSLPVDLVVEAGAAALSQAVVDRLSDVPGVTGVVSVETASVTLARSRIEVHGLEPRSAREVLRAPALLDGVSDDTLIMSPATARSIGVRDGGRLRLAGAELRVRASGGPPGTALTTARTLGRLVTDPEIGQVWLRLGDFADAEAAVRATEGAVDEVPGATVGGTAPQRQAFDDVLDAALAAVTGLLSVAVVIAVVGVANTMSLSELERRRESALLRALGMPGVQLRAMFALEAGLVAAVGGLIGVALGMIYGWAGTAALLGGSVDSLRLTAPTGQLVGLVTVAVGSGLLASAAPGRRAARTSPVITMQEQ